MQEAELSEMAGVSDFFGDSFLFETSHALSRTKVALPSDSRKGWKLMTAYRDHVHQSPSWARKGTCKPAAAICQV